MGQGFRIICDAPQAQEHMGDGMIHQIDNTHQIDNADFWSPNKKQHVRRYIRIILDAAFGFLRNNPNYST